MKSRLFATLSALLLSTGLTAGLWTGPVQAAVFFDDSFEGGSPSASGWEYAQGVCGGSPCSYMNVSTEQAHSGSKSLRLYYPPAALTDQAGTWNQAIGRGIPPNTNMYMRYWYRTSGFSYGPLTGTKHIYWRGNAGVPNGGSINYFGSRELSFGGQGFADCGYTTCNFYPNMARKPLADNVWYCIEEHFKLNDVGQANGMIEVWIDGAQTLGYYNRTMKGTVPNGPDGNSSNMVFDHFQIYKQTGSGLMYYDQFAVGTTRFGCTGSVPASDTTPPAPPFGLVVR